MTARGPARTGDIHVAGAGGGDANPHSDGHGGRALTLDLELPEGAHHDFVLVLSERDARREPPPDPERAWQAAEAEWRRRVCPSSATRSRRATLATPTPCSPA